jgi:Peptidase inhibitor family I36
MKRIRLLVATAALAVVGALSAPAATASAGPDPARIGGIRRPADQAATPVCPPGDLCGWTGRNYSGTRGALEENNTALPTIPWHEVRSVGNDGRHCSVWLSAVPTSTAKAATWRNC